MIATCPQGHIVPVMDQDQSPTGLVACHQCQLYFDPFAVVKPVDVETVKDDEIEVE